MEPGRALPRNGARRLCRRFRRECPDPHPHPARRGRGLGRRRGGLPRHLGRRSRGWRGMAGGDLLALRPRHRRRRPQRGRSGHRRASNGPSPSCANGWRTAAQARPRRRLRRKKPNRALPSRGRRGEGGVGRSRSTPTAEPPHHEQVRAAPRPEGMSGGHGDLLIALPAGERERQGMANPISDARRARRAGCSGR